MKMADDRMPKGLIFDDAVEAIEHLSELLPPESSTPPTEDE